MGELLSEPNNWFLYPFLMFLKIVLDATRFPSSLNNRVQCDLVQQLQVDTCARLRIINVL
jgi:hypothetical protein